ncbi:hypothetical protein [Kineosporia succinea]|uniref:Uncharacterized protein n=1 Tax=Kineosporia succinea TaxID=84632 RepID=A0ABT9P270_9ACTN|nr:hypothetical protein [Kineosporia succinea]MDP9826777.1 hypothetical protein [Kineosporia succinea]
MLIDDAVEAAVREGFAASVFEDPDQFDAAIDAILEQGDDFTINAFQLTINVTAVVLQDLHDGDVPAEGDIEDLAQNFAETQENWSEVSADLARTYMSAAVGEKPVLEVMDPGDVATTGLAVGGWLLAVYPPDEQEWTDYLDEVLHVLEGAQGEVDEEG